MPFAALPPSFRSPSTSVGAVMRTVLVAMMPGLAAQFWQFGPAVAVQLAIAMAAALAGEAAVLKMRRRPVISVLKDGSALVTATLLGAAVPPLLPWWLTAFGTLFAMIFGKQLYGGLGFNPFNPAMVGYAMLLISFPKAMSQWLPPVYAAADSLSGAETLSAIFLHVLPEGMSFDALARATPLDEFKNRLALDGALVDTRSAEVFGTMGGQAWAWVNLGYLFGGLWLLWRRVIRWQIPTAFLGALMAAATLCFWLDPSRFPTPLFHLSIGATMLAAFFVATDPVSAATTPAGRLIYGGLIGFLVFVIRSFGGFPDGVAFAVLLMNFAAPMLDHWLRPKGVR